MKHFGFIFILLLLLFQSGFTQEWEVSFLSPLDRLVSESSGLLIQDGKGITHNDSGNDSKLFEIDLVTGKVLRSVFVRNATIVDWEDICRDENYLFIADFGNNQGTRTDLRILKIEIDSFLKKDTVRAEFIYFDYRDQDTFSPAPFETNYDAEALVSYRDSLFIFTKQWGNFKTRVYPLSKVPGEYSISAIDSLDTNFMVTGADVNESSNLMGIVGYNFSRAFFLPLPADELRHGFSRTFNVFTLETTGSMQVEALAFDKMGLGYFTSESNTIGDASLYSLMRAVSSQPMTEPRQFNRVYPNPSSDRIYFDKLVFNTVIITSPIGKVVESSNYTSSINVSHLEPGFYFVAFYDENMKVIFKQIILKQ